MVETLFTHDTEGGISRSNESLNIDVELYVEIFLIYFHAFFRGLVRGKHDLLRVNKFSHFTLAREILIYSAMPYFLPGKMRIFIFSLTKIKPSMNLFYHLGNFW